MCNLLARDGDGERMELLFIMYALDNHVVINTETACLLLNYIRAYELVSNVSNMRNMSSSSILVSAIRAYGL